MSDPRTEEITVTMTGEEWDALRANPGISSYVRWQAVESARAKLDAAQAAQADRRAVALAEVEQRRNPLNARRKRWIRYEVRCLLAEHDAGTLRVDHLGSPANAIDGWLVALIPHTSGGEPAIHVSSPAVHFEGKQWPMQPEDFAWVVATIREEAEVPEAHYWNHDGPWVTVHIGFRAVAA